jgi:thiol-disulfide isomerase/thioredoxin
MMRTLLCMLVVVATSTVYARRQTDPNAYRPRNLDKITYDNHEYELQAGGFHWVLFGATWCPHTQDAIPIFDKFAKHYTYSNGHRMNYHYAYVDERSSFDYYGQKNLRGMYNVTVYPNIRMYYNGDYMHRFKSKRNFQKLHSYLQKVVPIVLQHTQNAKKKAAIGSS